MRIDVVTIFPEYLAPARLSLVGKAIEQGRIDLAVHDLRDAATDRHRTVDDAPFGGGPGMVMLAEPWAQALEPLLATSSGTAAGTQRDTDTDADTGSGAGAGARAAAVVLVPTPSGTPFTQRTAERYAREVPHLVIACGRYEGIDARVWEHLRSRGVAVEELSIGDYVLAGGEVAALVIIEATARLLPGVLGNEDSAGDDSFARDAGSGLLEGPVYTRPRVWRGLAVPDVLLSGDHARIRRWRDEQARARTAEHRPDLA